MSCAERIALAMAIVMFGASPAMHLAFDHGPPRCRLGTGLQQPRNLPCGWPVRSKSSTQSASKASLSRFRVTFLMANQLP